MIKTLPDSIYELDNLYSLHAHTMQLTCLPDIPTMTTPPNTTLNSESTIENSQHVLQQNSSLADHKPKSPPMSNEPSTCGTPTTIGRNAAIFDPLNSTLTAPTVQKAVWNRLTELNLDHNPIAKLPKGFGVHMISLQILKLNGLCTNDHRFIWLHEQYN